MSRELKKVHIKADNKKIMASPHVIIIGSDPLTKQVQVNLQGQLGVDEVLDALHTVEFEMLQHALRYATKDIPEKDIEKETAKFRDALYDRSVAGYSLMIDRFHPDKKKDKFDGLTDEAIVEAQTRILKKKAAANK